MQCFPNLSRRGRNWNYIFDAKVPAILDTTSDPGFEHSPRLPEIIIIFTGGDLIQLQPATG
jgi:hypothetical protein